VRRALAAPLLDLACIVVFVLIGEHTHGVSGGPETFLVILWPLAAGWAVLSLATALYRRPQDSWPRLIITWAAGLALGLVLRSAVTGRPTTLGLLAVTYGFIGATTAGWRLIALLVLRLRGAGAAIPGGGRSRAG
jgi:hypothetical protein